MLSISTGKELFWNLCRHLSELKLVVDEEALMKSGWRQSVSFVVSNEEKKQVAAVQYNGGKKNIEMGQVMGVTVRFYMKRMRELGLDHVIKNYDGFRSELKGPSISPYYEYTFQGSYFHPERNAYIASLFADLDDMLLDTTFDSLPVMEIPELVKELPRSFAYKTPPEIS
jgi:hypothetical protein